MPTMMIRPHATLLLMLILPLITAQYVLVPPSTHQPPPPSFVRSFVLSTWLTCTVVQDNPGL